MQQLRVTITCHLRGHKQNDFDQGKWIDSITEDDRKQNHIFNTCTNKGYLPFFITTSLSRALMSIYFTAENKTIPYLCSKSLMKFSYSCKKRAQYIHFHLKTVSLQIHLRKKTKKQKNRHRECTHLNKAISRCKIGIFHKVCQIECQLMPQPR